jgi:hypothetical protein
VKRAVYQE